MLAKWIEQSPSRLKAKTPTSTTSNLSEGKPKRKGLIDVFLGFDIEEKQINKQKATSNNNNKQ